MRILVTGATGFIGSEVVSSLKKRGDDVVALVRAPRVGGLQQITWDPLQGPLDPSHVSGFDVVINLAGESVAARWSEEKKLRLRKSRITLTQGLCETLIKTDSPPKILISTSASGYYGSRGDEDLTEESASGDGFLAALCRDWEAATEPARDHGIRVAILRLGIVLGASGGALATMIPIFRRGFGGMMGNGRQWWPWIALEDVTGIITYIIDNEGLDGPMNTSAPEAVRNSVFTRLLATALQKRALFSIPALTLKLLYGQMAEETLLASQHMKPMKLMQSGYVFRYPDVVGVLDHILSQEQK